MSPIDLEPPWRVSPLQWGGQSLDGGDHRPMARHGKEARTKKQDEARTDEARTRAPRGQTEFCSP